MAYQNLTMRNIAGELTAVFNDNNMRAQLPPEPASGPVLFSLGTAKSGFIAQPFGYQNRVELQTVFDPRSELVRAAVAAKNANASTPLVVSRIGAKPSHVMIKREIPDSNELETLIMVKPIFMQEGEADRNIQSTLEGLQMVLKPYVEGNLVRQRVLLYAKPLRGDSVLVYDSEGIIRADGDLAFDVEINVPAGEFLFTADAISDTALLNKFVNNGSYTLEDIKLLGDLLSSTTNVERLSGESANLLGEIRFVDIFDSSNTDTLTNLSFHLDRIDGSAPDYIDNLERYAGAELAYKNLEFENIDMLYCEGCYADTAPVELSSSDTLAEQLQWHKTKLGYFWKYIFNGKPNMFFFARKNPFLAENVASYVSGDLQIVLSDDNKSVGDLLNLVNMHLHSVSGAAASVESFWNDRGEVECHVTADFTVAGTTSVSVVTPFATLTLSADLADGQKLSHKLRPSVIGGSRALSDYLISNETNSIVSQDPFVINHFKLVGDLVAEAVCNRLMTFPEEGAAESVLLAAANVEVREVSFLHQAAQAAYTASTNYSQTVAIVPCSKPAISHSGVSEWAGNPAEYQVTSTGELVVTKAGTGVLGTKLLAGHPDYRGGVAFGGVILTNGNDLPNEIPYGIDDQDEALDTFGNPIDLGKHAIVVGSWGFMTDPASTSNVNKGSRIRTNQRSSAFVSAASAIAGKLSSLQPGTEPIGPVRGVVDGITPAQRTPKAMLDNLAALRVCMIDQSGVISSIYTSALRTSDYSKLSSIMAANAILANVRAACLPVIGAAYTDQQIQSLTQRLDGMSLAMEKAGYAQSGTLTVSLNASRLDRINGVLRANVRFVPPLSIEAISIDITLDAPSA